MEVSNTRCARCKVLFVRFRSLPVQMKDDTSGMGQKIYENDSPYLIVCPPRHITVLMKSIRGAMHTLQVVVCTSLQCFPLIA